MVKNKAALALRKWIDEQRDESKEHPLTVTAFADRLGVTTASIYNWINADHLPDRDMARKLEKATGGAVPSSDW